MRTPSRRLLLRVAVPLLVVLGVGVAFAVRGRSPAPKITTKLACPQLGRSKPPPAGFPADLPLPRGTVITRSRRHTESPRFPHTLSVDGYVPLTFSAAVAFFRDTLPRHGYRVTGGDLNPAEAEAQTRIRGHGYTGAVKVVKLNCLQLSAFFVGLLPRKERGRSRLNHPPNP